MAAANRQIQHLIHRYAELLDAGDLDGVGRLFEHARYGAGDGALVMTGDQVAEVNKSLVILYEDGTPGTAASRSYFSVLQQVGDGPLQPIVAGRYHDRFERVAGAWRFSERRIFVDLAGDLSRHLRSTIKQGD